MNADALYQVFNASLSHEQSTRKNAEEQLKQLHQILGSLGAVMHIIAENSAELHIRKAAAVYFKNRIRQTWDVQQDGGEHKISPQDREVAKAQILPLMAAIPASLQLLLASALSAMLITDFPDQWPDFIQTTMGYFKLDNPQSLHAGLVAVRECCKTYQFRVKENRAPLALIVQQVFPSLLSIGGTLVADDSIEAAELLKTIFKTYFSAIQYDLHPQLQEATAMQAWSQLFLAAVQKVDHSTGDDDAREAHPWWKTKKWAMHCLNRIFTRYGNPALLPEDNKSGLKPFAEWYLVHIAQQVMNVYMGLVDAAIQGTWLSQRCRTDVLNYFSDAIKHKTTWLSIKPHVNSIISHFIFPQICLTPADIKLWADDPTEYISKKIDPLEDFRNPVSAALNLFMELARDRKKVVFLPLLQFINEIMLRYNEAPVESKNYIEKEGAMMVIGAIAEQTIAKKSPVKDKMEEFLTVHIFPEFTSPHGFLRARACDTVTRFEEMEYSSPQHMQHIFSSIMACLRDPEIPVRVYAALAIRPLIGHDTLRDALVANLGVIMEQLLQLTQQVDADVVAGVMEELTEVFAEEMAPYATQLCEKLAQTYLHIIQDVGKSNGMEATYLDSEGAEGKIWAAAGIIKTVSTLLVNIDLTREMLDQVEVALMPMFTYSLNNAIVDLYDDLFEVIDCCTFCCKSVSANMWGLFDSVYTAFKEHGIDHVEEMLPSLDNYISFGREVVTTNPAILAKFIDVVDTILKSDRCGETDRVNACKLAESLLLNCKGSLDTVVPHFIDLVAQYMMTDGSIKTNVFRFNLIEMLINCIYYNPQLALSHMDQRGVLSPFFSAWFQNLQHLTRVHDKKLQIVTLCDVLELEENMPASLHSGLGDIFKALLSCLRTLPEAEDRRKAMEDLMGDGDSDDDDAFDAAEEVEIDELGFDEDDNVIDPREQMYLQMLAESAAQHADEEDDDDDGDDELEEELELVTPLDAIDVYARFKEMVQHVQNKPVYGGMTAALDPQDQQVLSQLLS